MVQRIDKVVIVGGGSAGWMAAAVLARAMGPLLEIELIESDAIPIVGVGEATIPQIHLVNRFLGFDEDEFIRRTQASFKLGISFEGWGPPGERYIHAFGDIGLPLGMQPFSQYWLKSRAGGGASSLWDYSLNARAAYAGKFDRIAKVGETRLDGIKYAFHFDATLYARFLSDFAQERGVRRTEGRVVDVKLRSDDGFIESLQLENGAMISGDLFLDCTGFRALLIEGALQTGYEDWSAYLPCDRAVAVPSTAGGPMRPYTQSLARPAGWQWRIPLQHRTGNGHVYCSAHMSDDEATALLLDHLEGEALAEPRVIRFTTGRRRRFWSRNCIALGLAAGFMEPLESTAIYLVQAGISRLLGLFPDKACAPARVDEYNRQTVFEYERIRDFLVLHYKAAQRTDSAFWRACTHMDIPQTLAHKIALFEQTGLVLREGQELFTEPGWLQVMTGQHIAAKSYHPQADLVPPQQLDGVLADLRKLIGQTVQAMPTHQDFIRQHCAAPPP